MKHADSASSDQSKPHPASELAGESAPESGQKESKKGFSITDDGCRTEIRLGLLLIIIAVFAWQFLGPQVSTVLYLLGIPLLLVGVPLQAIQSRRDARPGFPFKAGLIYLVLGLAMIPGMLYREGIGAPLQVQVLPLLLIGAGLWICAWWPWARLGGRKEAV